MRLLTRRRHTPIMRRKRRSGGAIIMKNILSNVAIVLAGVLLSLGYYYLHASIINSKTISSTPENTIPPVAPVELSKLSHHCSNSSSNDIHNSKVQKVSINKGHESHMQRIVAEISECLTFFDCINNIDVAPSITPPSLAPPQSIAPPTPQNPPHDKLEGWARVILESMSAPSRTFHGIQHAFDMSDNAADEVQKVSAFFHDCIYYNVDGGLSADQHAIVGDIIDEKEGDGIYLKELTLPLLPLGEDYDYYHHSQISIQMVVDIFGFTAGQKLNPYGGLNEFLSAVLAVRSLSQHVRPRYLAEITACIEATVPFRSGEPMEDLYNRLKRVNDNDNEAYATLQMTDGDIVAAVQRATDFANRDVLTFADSNPRFLSNTWDLLPESNVALRHTRVVRISDYSAALWKMTNFLKRLDPNTIFKSFRGRPDDESVASLTEAATQNINIAVKYMQCKQLAISVVGAFAEFTGGDAPVALFLGDLPGPDHTVRASSPSVEDFITTTTKSKGSGVALDDTVLALLRDGRERANEFDMKHSPVAAFLYSEIGDVGLEEAMKNVVYPMDEEHSAKLLLSLPKNCVIAIGSACARIATTRHSLLIDILGKIQNGEIL